MYSLEAHVTPESDYYSYTPGAVSRQYFLYPLLIGSFEYTGGYDLVRQSYDSFLMEIILDGEMVLETEGRRCTAKKNDIVILDCYRPHRYYSDVGWKALWVHFDGAAAAGYYRLICQNRGNVFQMPEYRHFRRVITDLYDMIRNGKVLDEAQMSLMLTEALTLMARRQAAESADYTEDRIRNLIAKINRDISGTMTVDEMAEWTGVSKYHFIRVFTEVAGVTPHQYLMTARIDRAKYLLKTTALSVRRIGEMVGYSTESMFCAAFKRISGKRPGEYRKDVQVHT